MRTSILLLSCCLFGSAQAATYQGKASFYRAAGMTCAHRSLPIGTHVRVTNLANNRSAELIVSGRGPFVRGRVVDVSTAAAGVLGFRRAGVVPVLVETAER